MDDIDVSNHFYEEFSLVQNDNGKAFSKKKLKFVEKIDGILYCFS
jgi:hypothetical protein